MHNFFYPMHWRETTVDIQKIWILNECKSKEDLDKADELFKQANFLKDSSFRQKSFQHILKLSKASPNNYEEVQQIFFQALNLK